MIELIVHDHLDQPSEFNDWVFFRDLEGNVSSVSPHEVAWIVVLTFFLKVGWR